MRVATFNCNSVRVRLLAILDWLDAYAPDVLALQETKVENSLFPVAQFRERGWHVAFHGQKSYNGVALVSKGPLENVRVGFGDDAFPEDFRIIRAAVGGTEIINTYVPNGSTVGSEKFEYKLRWLKRFRQLLDEYDPAKPLVWVGDINIAPTPDDVFEPAKHLGKVGHHPDEFAALAAITDWGLTDVFRKFHEGPGHYSFWEFVIPNAVKRNLGWRIDHIYATHPEACKACEIDAIPRSSEKPSDHTFVYADFEPAKSR